MSENVQLGRVLREIVNEYTRNLGQRFLDGPIDRFNKEYITGSGITLRINEIKFRK